MTQPDTSMLGRPRNTITVNVCPKCDEPVLPGEGWKIIPDPDAAVGEIKAAVAHWKCGESV